MSIDPNRNDIQKVIDRWKEASANLSRREIWYLAEMLANNVGCTLMDDPDELVDGVNQLAPE